MKLCFASNFIGTDGMNDDCCFLKHFLCRSNGEDDVKLRRASIVVGTVTSIIFLICVAIVTLMLHYSPELEKLATGESLHVQFNVEHGAVNHEEAIVTLMLHYSPELEKLATGESLIIIVLSTYSV